jgi:hypothetical protein
MRKNDRELTCVAVYTIAGLDLRLLEGEEMLRTQLCDNGPMLQGTARGWQKALRAAGWV